MLLSKRPAEIEVGGDKNPEISNLWFVLKSVQKFPRFLARVQETEFERSSWDRVGVYLQQFPDADPVSKAAWYFVLSRLSRAGQLKDFLTTSTRLRRGMPEHESAWLSAIANLPRIHARLQNVTVLPPMDAVDVIQKYDGPDCCVYADPPYLHATRTATQVYGDFEMSDADHEQLLDVLLACKGQVLLSGYDNPLYATKLAGWNRHEKPMPADSAGGRSKSRRVEILWSNR